MSDTISITVPPEKVAELVRNHLRAEHPSLASWNDTVKVDRRGVVVEFLKPEPASGDVANS